METLHFYDKVRGMMKLEEYGREAKPWLFYKHPDGQWVTLREATDDDLDGLGRKGLIWKT